MYYTCNTHTHKQSAMTFDKRKGTNRFDKPFHTNKFEFRTQECREYDKLSSPWRRQLARALFSFCQNENIRKTHVKKIENEFERRWLIGVRNQLFVILNQIASSCRRWFSFVPDGVLCVVCEKRWWWWRWLAFCGRVVTLALGRRCDRVFANGTEISCIMIELVTSICVGLFYYSRWRRFVMNDACWLLIVCLSLWSDRSMILNGVNRNIYYDFF